MHEFGHLFFPLRSECIIYLPAFWLRRWMLTHFFLRYCDVVRFVGSSGVGVGRYFRWYHTIGSNTLYVEIEYYKVHIISFTKGKFASNIPNI